jgi:hypothetical protein
MIYRDIKKELACNTKEYLFRSYTYRMGIEKEEEIPKILHNLFLEKKRL